MFCLFYRWENIELKDIFSGLKLYSVRNKFKCGFWIGFENLREWGRVRRGGSEVEGLFCFRVIGKIEEIVVLGWVE